MANLPCPFERAAEATGRLMARVRRMALAHDQYIDDDERQTLDGLRVLRDELQHRSALRKAARHLEQIDDVTEYSHRLFAAADLDIVDLAAERARRRPTVLAFPATGRDAS